MAEYDSAQERTESATPRRQREARRRGQVPRSRELETAIALLGAALFLYFYGGTFATELAALMRDGLRFDTARLAAFELAPTQALAQPVLAAIGLVAPFAVLLVLIALLAPLLLGGWTFSMQALAWHWERVSLVQGLRRVFSWRALAELLKALAKFAVVAAVAWGLWQMLADDLPNLALAPSVGAGIMRAAQLLAWVCLVLCASTLLIAALDVPYQLWTYQRQLRMTRQELRDELKETEGRPEVRARLRGAQREIARRRMMMEIPRATVVVTNPIHYAVALRYAPPRMRAPVVVAKGADWLAESIREAARAHGVPIISSPPLARALYRGTRIGQEIPAGLYTAVARVLAYVYQLRAARQPGDRPPEPPRVEEREIPIALRGD